MAKKIIRVFARRTSATPIDENVRIRCTPGFWEEADEVHVSVTFSWDRAFERMKQTYEAGFFPMAMLYRDATGTYTQSWRKFQRQWANLRITHYNCMKYFGKRKNSRLVD